MYRRGTHKRKASGQLTELVSQYSKLLVELSCTNHLLLDENDHRDIFLYCTPHGMTHGVRPRDRKRIWQQLKKDLVSLQGEDLDELVPNAHAEFTRQLSALTKSPSEIERSRKLRAKLRREKKEEMAAQAKERAKAIQLTEAQAKEFWECLRKNYYMSKAVADTAIDFAMNAAGKLHSYKCSHGEHWHIGHPRVRDLELTGDSYYRNKLSDLRPKELAMLELYKERLSKQ